MDTKVLDQEQIEKKINRISHQIFEQHSKEKEVILIGIRGGGYKFAERIFERLQEVATFKVSLIKIEIKKKDPLSHDIKLSEDVDLNGKRIVVVDDVANTGSTMFYAIQPIMKFKPKSVKVAVMVDRMHKKFPISSDYVGLQLATTMQEHITVDFRGEEFGAWLS